MIFFAKIIESQPYILAKPGDIRGTETKQVQYVIKSISQPGIYIGPYITIS